MPHRPAFRLWLSLVAAAVTLLGAPGAASGAVLESSVPPVGGSLPEPSHVDLRFSEPVELAPDGVRLLGPGGASLPVGAPEVLPDGVVRVPIAGSGTGLRVLAWSGSAAGEPISGSVAFDVGPSATGALAVERMAAAAAGAGLGAALVGAGLAAVAAAALLIVRGARQGGGRRVPWAAVLVGAAGVALIGALAGLWMVQRSVGAVGAGDGAITRLWIAFAAAAAIAVAAAGLARVAARRRSIGLAIALAAIAGAVGVWVAPALPEAAAAVDARILLDDGVSVAVALQPGAVGRNEATVTVQGAEDAAAAPVLVLRPLAGGIGPLRVPLAATAEGAFATDALLLVLPGRWRGQVEGLPGIAADEPVLFDFSVQPNPGVAGG